MCNAEKLTVLHQAFSRIKPVPLRAFRTGFSREGVSRRVIM